MPIPTFEVHALLYAIVEYLFNYIPIIISDSLSVAENERICLDNVDQGAPDAINLSQPVILSSMVSRADLRQATYTISLRIEPFGILFRHHIT